MITASDRQRVRGALLDRNPKRLERVFAGLVFAGEHANDIETVAREELGRVPHEVHAWWQAPCECKPPGEPETAST